MEYHIVRMSKVIELTGRTFGRLTVIGRAPHEPRFRKAYGWLCRCECGNTISTIGQSLQHGNTRSCGCLRAELSSARRTTHGRAGSAEHRVWVSLRRRCYDRRDKSYARYGGRGIAVCSEWREDFAAFLRDMGPRPAGASIDRIDNSGPYAPWNCRWTTPTVQANNRRSSRVIEHAGVRKTLQGWIDATGLPLSTLRYRLAHWGVEKALSTPVRPLRGDGRKKCHNDAPPETDPV